VRRGAVVARRVVVVGLSRSVVVGLSGSVVVAGCRGCVGGVVDVGTIVEVGRIVEVGTIVEVGAIVVAVTVVAELVGRRIVIEVDVSGVETVTEIALDEPLAGETSCAARNPPTASAAMGTISRRLIPGTRALYRLNANMHR